MVPTDKEPDDQSPLTSETVWRTESGEVLPTLHQAAIAQIREWIVAEADNDNPAIITAIMGALIADPAKYSDMLQTIINEREKQHGAEE